MKTTIEVPDALFRAAKAHAAQQGVSLKTFFERAVSSELRQTPTTKAVPAWRRSFGKLRSIRDTTREVQRVVDREFSRIEVDSWR